MIGTSQNTIATNLGANGTIAASIGGQSAGSSAAMRAQYAGQLPNSLSFAPWVLLGLLALYLIWAVVIQHQRVREQLEPSNIAANVHNFLVITVAAVIGIVFGKIFWAKLTALGVPGASTIGRVWAAA